MDFLNLFSDSFITIILHAVPFLLIGALLSGIIEVFFSREDLSHWLPHNVLGKVLVGGLLGVFFPVCNAGAIPLARRLMRKGFPAAVGITFILAAPTLNPIAIFSTLSVFGNGPIFWGRLGVTWIVAILVGLVFSFQDDPHKLVTVTIPIMEAVSIQKNLVDEEWREKIFRVLTVTADDFFDIGKLIVLGAGLAAICQVLIPQTAIIIFDKGPVVSVLSMIVLAFIKSIGSAQNASVGQFFTAINGSGSLVAFLVSGSFVDLKGILTFTRLFRPKTVIYIFLISLLITVLLSVLMNMLIY